MYFSFCFQVSVWAWYIYLMTQYKAIELQNGKYDYALDVSSKYRDNLNPEVILTKKSHLQPIRDI